jgi:Ca-activated chloride channel family protein
MPDWRTLGFIWPDLLWLLLLAPMLLLAYAWVRRPSSLTWLSALGGLILALGLVALLAATARPQVDISLPARADRLMLVLDISGSMRADDIKPSRFDAAKQTLRQLIEQQPNHIRVGLVTTAATATLVQTPTTDRSELLAAMENISLQTGSALGTGLLIGLAELMPQAGIDAQSLMNASLNRNNPEATPVWKLDPQLVAAPGSNRSVAMVVLSDGDSNMGVDIIAVADLAAQLGVRVHTVGIGTKQGAVVRAEGIAQRVQLQSDTLADVAQTTVGTYYETTRTEDINAIYQGIETNIVFDQARRMEITALVTAIGLLLVLIGGALSLWRSGRVF